MLVPRTVIELYIASLKNRTLVTIIKAVSASRKVIPLVLIIVAKTHMDSWYNEGLYSTELVLLLESRYIND